MKRLITLSLFIALVACQNKSKSSIEGYSITDNKIAAQEMKSASISNETTEQVILNYLKIKDALVRTDAGAAAFAAEGLLFDLEQNENKVVNKLFKEVKLIAKSKEVDEQRIYFEGLSQNIYTLVKNTDLEMTLYQQFCPMAFEDKGAYWISDEKKVYNPYFGDEMLRCGKVSEVIE